MVEHRVKIEKAKLEQAVREIERQIVALQRQQASLEERRIQVEQEIASKDEQIERAIAVLNERKRGFENRLHNLES